jgi:hypothetical protein
MIPRKYNLGILQANPQVLTVQQKEEVDIIVSLYTLPFRCFCEHTFAAKCTEIMKIFIYYRNLMITFLLTNFLLFISLALHNELKCCQATK